MFVGSEFKQIKCFRCNFSDRNKSKHKIKYQMKKLVGIIMLAITTLTAFGQRADRSTLNIRLSDGQPMLITINDRDYNKINTTITLYDLPKKRHHIRVYKYRAYADGKGGKAQLVYSGKIKVDPGNTYDCIVDVNKRRFLMKPIAPQLNPKDRHTDPRYNLNEKNDRTISDLSNSHPHLAKLQEEIQNVKEDSKKLALAEQFVKTNSITTYDLRLIGSWIMFDDNRLTLFKTAYQQVSDKDNFSVLYDMFAMDEGKQGFNNFLQQVQ